MNNVNARKSTLVGTELAAGLQVWEKISPLKLAFMVREIWQMVSGKFDFKEQIRPSQGEGSLFLL